MDFEFFEGLSPDEAAQFLADYLKAGSEHLSDLELIAASASLRLDFTLSSLRPVFERVASLIGTTPVEIDESLPEWIKASPDYRAGLFEFDEDSRPMAGWLSYYLGETLVRSASGALAWGIGDPDTAEENQPVVSGFEHGVQMAPLLVTENLLRRLIEESDPLAGEDVDVAVQTWSAMIAPSGA